MQTQDIFSGAEALPAQFTWRGPLLWLLLALLPLWAGLLLPPVPQRTAALHGNRHGADAYTVAFGDGRRLVCESCRRLGERLQRLTLGGSPAQQAPASLQPEQPRPNAVPTRPAIVTRSLVAVRQSLPRHSGRTNFEDDVGQALPRYRVDFEEAARRNGLDWRLLAAVGYQESRWNPQAESPTGVRGLMMLTTDTALDLGVDRNDGAQSIAGAGRLLQSLFEQLPPQIREPDRTAMVLAAYNQGIGHLLDARDVVVNLGGDPDSWSDVRKALPLLSDAEWQKTTKYGAARGSEAVAFVDGVRLYYVRLMAMSPGTSHPTPARRLS